MDRAFKITSSRRRAVAASAMITGALGLLTVASAAWAQAPPHQPGSLCYTQEGWCLAQPPGPPGSPCACPSNGGLIPGVRG